MCSTPWSESAWITISAPVMSVMVHSTRSAVSGIKKGPESPYARIATFAGGLAALGDALPKYGNKIAHKHTLSAFRFASLIWHRGSQGQADSSETSHSLPEWRCKTATEN